ncbi:MAG TPA: flagellar export chaperone FliS [Candidatus Gastranaerophilaceae bacterium]|nr:flagellar export chaperone FliS [Candidatus Gastranaerophilaceae bacterium]HPT41233.1 flagellar export chaperone FliS [Candidatus Gastranaerophilaceae bacterium]
MNNLVNPYLKQYQKNQVETASPEQVLILLYDGAIQYLNKAKIAIGMNDIEQIQKNLTGCERIILEFMSTLDIKNGGSLAQNLYKLYDYLYNTLVEINVSKDEKKLEEVLRHLTGLRETWNKAIAMANAERQSNLNDFKRVDIKDDQDYEEGEYFDQDDEEQEDE